MKHWIFSDMKPEYGPLPAPLDFLNASIWVIVD